MFRLKKQWGGGGNDGKALDRFFTLNPSREAGHARSEQGKT